MHAFAALGSLAGEITGVLQAEGEEAARIAQAQGKLEHLLDQAKQLFEAARKDDFPEVARDVDALRQRIVALRKRLVLPAESKSNGV
jgi:polyhydroxyalkanoate synthesis regulator phasin